MDADALISYYVDRLVYQYRAKPKARASIAILVKQLVADGLLRSIEDAFWLDRAIGAQLDTLGKYVGVPRGIGPIAARDFFGFHDYVAGAPDNDNGFRDYTDATVNGTGEWYSYDTATRLRTDLEDYAYAFIIRWKAALNVWDGTMAGALAFHQQFFPTQTTWRLADNWGAVGYVHYHVDSDIGLDPATFLPYLPRPVGKRVRLTYERPGAAAVDYYFP